MEWTQYLGKTESPQDLVAVCLPSASARGEPRETVRMRHCRHFELRDTDRLSTS